MTWVAITAIFWATFANAQGNTAGETPKGERPKTSKVVPENPFPGNKSKAPPLQGGNGWVNTTEPVELAKLKGKIVLIDFWTFCCINCMQILPDLSKLEAEFPNELVVIGVHSAKFNNERDVDNIRNAVMRYDIRHPVVNDAEMTIWRSYGARSWPTLVLIDPDGLIIGSVSGEGHYDVLRTAIRRLADYHRAMGTLNAAPMKFELEVSKAPATPLKYPGKVIVDTASDRMFVADSGHNRIVIVKLSSGAVEAVIGSGKMGYKDGNFKTAEFDDPQGMAAKGDLVFVADRRNHSIRKINLKTKFVETVAGNGKQGYERDRGGAALSVSLASPWDVLWVDNSLYIAMAGLHQIWKLDFERNHVEPFAGSGREDILNADLRGSAFAQPSGLSTDGDWLYVADSEVSAVRKVGLKGQQPVRTLVGEGLFEFGDKDGIAARARLQHALGVAYADGKVYVADTYNNKIKVLDANSGDATTLLGDGWAGTKDNPARFDHPGGIHFAAGKLYVADTNNHAIRVVDPKSKTVSTYTIRGL